MKTLRILALAGIGALVATNPLRAHHDWPVDRSSPITLRGTVTGFTWANPHVTIALEVQTDGAVEKWILGGSSPKVMTDGGWDRDTLKPGDVITGIGYRFRNGSNVALLQKVVLASGRELYYGRPPRP
jgi:uncharacterized protein DUF6152